jgi:hypothetical protein
MAGQIRTSPPPQNKKKENVNMLSKAKIISVCGICGMLAFALVFATHPVEASAKVTRRFRAQVLQVQVIYQPPQWWGQAGAWAVGGAVAGAKGSPTGAALGAVGGFVGYALGDWAASNQGFSQYSRAPLTALD